MKRLIIIPDKNKTKISLFILLILIFISCGGSGSDTRSRAEILLSQMSIQDKVDQMSGGFETSNVLEMMKQIDNENLAIPS